LQNSIKEYKPSKHNKTEQQQPAMRPMRLDTEQWQFSDDGIACMILTEACREQTHGYASHIIALSVPSAYSPN
jgi:hypothetical protein